MEDKNTNPACKPNDMIAFIASKEIDMSFDPAFNPDAVEVEAEITFEHPNIIIYPN